jgi:chromate transporter
MEPRVIHDLRLLAEAFGGLSLLAVGGGNAIIPDMQRIVVDQYHWVTARQFLDLFAITRATPGPGSTIVLLIGQKVAGLPGALVGGIAMYAPSSLLVFLCARIWHHTQKSRAVIILERALGPIAIGLIFASAIVLVQSTEHTILAWCTTAAAVALLTMTDLNPLLILGGGAAIAALAACV